MAECSLQPTTDQPQAEIHMHCPDDEDRIHIMRALITRREGDWRSEYEMARKIRARSTGRVRAAITVARKVGLIQTQPCEVCNSPGHGHHDDYNRPLALRWLCHTHHMEWHSHHQAARLIPPLFGWSIHEYVELGIRQSLPADAMERWLTYRSKIKPNLRTTQRWAVGEAAPTPAGEAAIRLLTASPSAADHRPGAA